MLKRNWQIISHGIALVLDTAAIIMSVLSAICLMGAFAPITSADSARFAEFAVLAWGSFVAAATIGGLYHSGYSADLVRQYKLGIRIYLLSTSLTLASLYILNLSPIPGAFAVFYFGFQPLYCSLVRTYLNRLNLAMQKKGYGLHRTLIYGYGESEIKVLHRFAGYPELGYDLAGVLTKRDRAEGSVVRIGEKNVPTLWFNNIDSFVAKKSIDRIFIPSIDLFSDGAASLVDFCQNSGVDLKLLSRESDEVLNTLKSPAPAGITLISRHQRKLHFLRSLMKRAFDIVGASVLILLTAPIFVMTAAAIYLESGRPIFFRQRRTAAKGAQGFDCYKFRSMVPDADELKDQLFQENESDGFLFKIKSDPRVTRVGKFIRKTSIDELPQLFNVLKGDMSLIGPRPLPVGDFERVSGSPEFWEAMRNRGKVKPGISGLWQISGRSSLGFNKMIMLDFYYIENWSLLLDLKILLATIPVVLFGKGAC